MKRLISKSSQRLKTVRIHKIPTIELRDIDKNLIKDLKYTKTLLSQLDDLVSCRQRLGLLKECARLIRGHIASASIFINPVIIPDDSKDAFQCQLSSYNRFVIEKLTNFHDAYVSFVTWIDKLHELILTDRRESRQQAHQSELDGRLRCLVQRGNTTFDELQSAASTVLDLLKQYDSPCPMNPKQLMSDIENCRRMVASNTINQNGKSKSHQSTNTTAFTADDYELLSNLWSRVDHITPPSKPTLRSSSLKSCSNFSGFSGAFPIANPLDDPQITTYLDALCDIFSMSSAISSIARTKKKLSNFKQLSDKRTSQTSSQISTPTPLTECGSSMVISPLDDDQMHEDIAKVTMTLQTIDVPSNENIKIILAPALPDGSGPDINFGSSNSQMVRKKSSFNANGNGADEYVSGEPESSSDTSDDEVGDAPEKPSMHTSVHKVRIPKSLQQYMFTFVSDPSAMSAADCLTSEWTKEESLSDPTNRSKVMTYTERYRQQSPTATGDIQHTTCVQEKSSIRSLSNNDQNATFTIKLGSIKTEHTTPADTSFKQGLGAPTSSPGRVQVRNNDEMTVPYSIKIGSIKSEITASTEEVNRDVYPTPQIKTMKEPQEDLMPHDGVTSRVKFSNSVHMFNTNKVADESRKPASAQKISQNETSIINLLDAEEYLIFVEDKSSTELSLHAGSIDALIVYLVSPGPKIQSFRLFSDVFYAMYRTFMTTEKLLNRLILRYTFLRSMDPTSEVEVDVRSKSLKLLTSVVINVLNAVGGKVNAYCRQTVKRFQSTLESDSLDSLSKLIGCILDENRQIKDISKRSLNPQISESAAAVVGRIGAATKGNNAEDHFTNICSGDEQAGWFGKNYLMSKFKSKIHRTAPTDLEACSSSSSSSFSLIHQIHPSKLAEQLTYLEVQKFNQLDVTELLDIKKLERGKTPTVNECAAHFSKLSNWATYQLLQECTIERVKVAVHLLDTMENLRKLHNFSSLLSILCAFLLIPDSLLSRKILTMLERWKPYMQPPYFSAYRRDLQAANPPYIPYVGLMIQNLIILAQGNALLFQKPPEQLTDSYRSEHGPIVNFWRCWKHYEIINTLFKQNPTDTIYQISPSPEILKFINDFQDAPNKSELNATIRKLQVAAHAANQT